MFHAIDEIQYLGENTNTTGGLKVARTQVFGANYDQRRPAADRIIILITDGVPTRDVDLLPGEVQTIQAMGIRIVGLGVTNQVSADLRRFRVSACFIQRCLLIARN